MNIHEQQRNVHTVYLKKKERKEIHSRFRALSNMDVESQLFRHKAKAM